MSHKTVFVAVAILAGCTPSAVETTPTTTPVETTEIVETTVETTVATAPTTVAPTTAAPTVPPTTIDPALIEFWPYLDFMEAEAAFGGDVSDQLTAFADMLDRGDLSAATEASVELWSTFAFGERAPDGYPLAREHDTMMDDCEQAFDVVSDIFIAGNYGQLDAAIMADCMAGITDLTAALTEIAP